MMVYLTSLNSFVRGFPKPFTDIIEQNIKSKSEVVDTAIEVSMGLVTGAKWQGAYSHGMWVFGVTSPFDLLFLKNCRLYAEILLIK